MTMLRGKPKTAPEITTDGAPQFRENPEINAKIDDYIKADPKRWEYIQAMSRERMARTIVLQDVQKQERTERIRSSVLKKLDENPELKKAY
jgi:predicted RNA-binding protein with PUA-like domain